MSTSTSQVVGVPCEAMPMSRRQEQSEQQQQQQQQQQHQPSNMRQCQAACQLQ
ncbi:GH20250 [Drosophila grimshawi]|uniref:GH20250 n=1 Tax=Drosophila grimshawi TaxID=7222 RepID=B4J5M8_DROGR|nr:GH20250 [Drosophila grimshawi]